MSNIHGSLAITALYNCIDPYTTDGQWLPDNWLPYGGWFHLHYSVVLLVFLPLLLLFLKCFYLPIEKGLSARESGYLSLLSLFLASILACGLSFINYQDLSDMPAATFLFFALLLTVFIIYLLFFRMYYLVQEKYIMEQQSQRMEYQVALRDEQYLRLQDSIRQSRNMRHDLKHYLLTLQGFLARGELKQAEEYLEQYLAEVSRYEILKLCSNPLVDMLVSHYYILAKERDIDFAVRIRIPEELPVRNSDLSVLLGNLLENAVEGAELAPQGQRGIRFNMICQGNMLAVTVDNGFDGKVNMEGSAYASTKSGHSGLGLGSICYIAEKYGGGSEFSHDELEFHSSVLMGLGGAEGG